MHKCMRRRIRKTGRSDQRRFYRRNCQKCRNCL